ncbi:MAG: sigma-70 family RNA polymerase sigma factor [Planctomycetota bacterium]
MSRDHTKTVDLVLKARAGDSEAVAEIYRRYGPRLLRLIRARLSPKLRRRIESSDLLQSAFATALRDIELFKMREDGSLLHWLSVITTRKVAQIARSLGRERRDPSREVGIDAAALAMVSAAGPSTQVEASEEQRRMEAALDQLEEPYREAIILHDYAGMEFEQLAKRMHRPSAEAARKLHTKAKLMLGKLYGTMAAGHAQSEASGTHTSRKPSPG